MSSRLRRARTSIRLAAGRLGPAADSADERLVADARAGGPPPDFESRLAWILGSPRTGSTWLLRMIIHPAVLARRAPTGMARFPGARKQPIPAVVPVDESYLLNHIAPMRPAPPGGKPAPPDELTLNASRRADAGYLFADAYADVWRPAVRELILARFHAQAVRAEVQFGISDPLVLIKEPNGSHAAEFLLSLLPGSRLIFLVRDGRDVVDSLVALHRVHGGHPDGPDERQQANRLAFVRRQSDLWVNRTTAVMNAYEAHDPARRYRLSYEDLLRDTRSELRRLLEWLGLPCDDSGLDDAIAEHAFESLPKLLKGPGKSRRSATPGLWRENLTEGEQEVANEVMGAKLRELGYEA